MEDKILVLPVNSETFLVENYSTEDVNLITQLEVDTNFTSSTDYIEYYIFDSSKNLLFPGETEELFSYKVQDGHVILSPKQDLERNEFDEGDYFITYNFYRTHLGSDLSSKYYIEEISSDRTEIRLNSNTISNEELPDLTKEFIDYRKSRDYFVDFYLNFGNNDFAIANNVKLDVINENDYSILIKLYEPLSSDFEVKTECWVVEPISSPQSYQVKFPIPIFDPKDFEFIAGPNLNLNIKDETGASSIEHSYNTLANSNITSSTNQIQSLLEEKGIKINVNYEDFSNFIKFSSAKTRLENFYYKAGLIENYTNQIAVLDSNITSGTTGSTEFSESKATFENNINTIIKNFDSYEYFLYYNSGSDYSYPKSNTSPPYTLYSTGSTEVLSWLGSSDPTNAYYGGLALSASNYDENNQDYLHWNIPEYLRDDPDNRQYDLFIDMVGQHFDNIWIYTKDVVNKFNADNRLNYGISKDLVSDAIKDFGIKLYSNNFNTDDLYKAFLGLTPSGSVFPYDNTMDYYPVTSGYEYIDTKISASNDIIPLDDVNKRLYKRIYHNIPYLLKTKGTIAGLRALITSYGISDTILRIDEFGSKNKINKEDWDYKQNIFNYTFDVDGSNYFSSSFDHNKDFGAGRPDTIQFRFKTPGIPSGHLSQSLFSTEYSSSILIEYTGSSYSSGSYSGSISNPQNQYGTVKYIPDNSNPTLSASVYLPIFDGGWWSVMTTTNTNANLYVANKIENNIGHIASSSLEGIDSTLYDSAEKILFPYSSTIEVGGSEYQPFSGSIQEIRYYYPTLNTSSFNNFVLNPYSYKGNDLDTPNELVFRADLGSLSSTGSRTSIHPKITGSWEISSSFVSNDSSFYIATSSFVVNREDIYLNQVPQGIKNKVSDKISIFENVIPSGDTLSSERSIQQYSYLTQSTTPDADYLEVAFSPTNQINDDIIAELGNFNIGDYIGDPRHISESRTNYPDLDTLRDNYFKKYIKSYDVKDFVRLIKFFDNSLFKMIKDFTPARTNLSAGVVVKQHLLERNAYSATPVSHEDQTYSGSVKSFPRDYSTGSSDSSNYDPVSGSSLYVSKGGTVGMFERFSGLVFSPSGSDGNGPSNVFGITQSWADYFPSISGSVRYPRDDQREFFNGEFSQSSHVKLQRGLNLGDDDPCYEYLNWENVPDLQYRLEFFSGSNDAYRILPYTPPPPITGSEYLLSPYTSSTRSDACELTGSLSVYINRASINSILVGDTLYEDQGLTIPFNGTSSAKYWGIRTSGSTLLRNNFSLQLTTDGLITSKMPCRQAFDNFEVRDTDSTLTLIIEGNSTNVIGDYVTIGTETITQPGCYEIIAESTIPITPIYEVVGTCTPTTNPTSSVTLGYSANAAPLACSDGSFGGGTEYGISSLAQNPSFANADQIFDSGSDDLAAAGYYSDGIGFRYWTGTTFTGSLTFCGIMF